MEIDYYKKVLKDAEKSLADPDCIGCLIYKKFGPECYYYYEGKKKCSMRE